MSTRIETECIIAGGGPAGIMLGYLLARAGVSVTVCEKWPDFFRDFRGDTIHPSTMEILSELGLLDEFLKLPHNEMTRMTLHVGAKEQTIADFRRLKSMSPYIAFIPQWDFLNFLSSKAKEFPSFNLMMETEATSLIREHGQVVGISAKNPHDTFEIHGKLLVGADGRHSVIREQGGFKTTSLGVPIDVLWFRIGRGDVDNKESLGYLAKHGALVMLDRREYWQCAFVIQKDGFNKIKERGLESFRADIAHTAHLPLTALAELDSWDKVKLLSVTVDHADQWAQEGVLLIGDAAHAMSPIGGVGINYAIHDAVAAANLLVPAFKEKNLSLDILNQLQTRRSPAVTRMQRIQVFLQDKIFGPLTRGDGITRMPLFIKLFSIFPPLQGVAARVIGMGFRPEHIDPALRSHFLR